jgi:hypothetical protein
MAVAVLVGGGELADRAPRADIAPADVARHRGYAAGFLHERVVEGDIRDPGEALGVELELGDAIAGGEARATHAVTHCGKQFRAVLLHLGQHGAGGEAEHPGVPQEAARCHVLARLLEGRLLDEPQHVVAARLDVAVAGLGRVGADAERDEPAACSQRRGLRDRLGKCGLVEDEVVRGQHQQDRVIPVHLGDAQRGTRGRGRGVAPEGLENVGGRNARGVHLAEFVLRLEEKLAIGDGEDLGGARKHRPAQERLVEKALPVGQADERLGVQLARNRPKAGAGAAAEDGGNQTHESGGLTKR